MNVINLAGDPVYVAIRRHRAAISALNNYRGPENAEWLRLENTFFVAQDEFWRAVPTTPDGVNAKINAFLETARDGITINGLRGFLETFHEAARVLAVRS